MYMGLKMTNCTLNQKVNGCCTEDDEFRNLENTNFNFYRLF